MKRLIDLESNFTRYGAKYLLRDKTTGKNIIWATDSYRDRGPEYSPESQMEYALISGSHSDIVTPRVFKSRREKLRRTKNKAEVFTPTWVVNRMNNLCDRQWFGREEVFNREDSGSWEVTWDKISFPPGKTWKNYVDLRYMEITCGEAPFLVSRYDATNGDYIPLKDRIGVLDRKMRVIGENASPDEWYDWAVRAFQSVYGYEFQGDNLLCARLNLLMSFAEYYRDRYGRFPPDKRIRKIANIISWNLRQMDGLTGMPPYRHTDTGQLDLFSQSPPTDPRNSRNTGEDTPSAEDPPVAPGYCRFFDWRRNRSLTYDTLLRH